MAVVLLVVRPLSFVAHNILVNQIVNPGFSNMIRWQNHWHVVRQSWTFFQNDFAGRIANRVLQTGPALRESLVMAFDAAWYILVYGSSALVLLGRLDWRLTLPMVVWFVAYAAMLRYFVPRLRDRSRRVSEMRSTLTGRVVDSYTNILTVKLFARAADEDAFVRDAIDEHTAAFRDQTRMTTAYTSTLVLMNACLIVSMAAVALWQWSDGHIAIGAVATAIPLAWQLNNIAGWVARSVTSIFENIGTVQDGMRSIDVPRQMPDPPDAGELQVTGGEIRFENLHFDYGRVRENTGTRYPAVLHGINLTIAPGERVGLIGPSGAGKSTLVNLLLHFFDPAAGRILIDGQDIAARDPGKPAPAHRHGDPGHLAAAPLDPGEHPLRPAAGDRRADHRRRQAGAGARIHPGPGGLARPPRLRRPCRGARGEAVRRAAPARRAGSGHPEGRADPDPGRGDLGAGFRGRGGDPGAARHADGRAHGDRHRPSAIDHRPDGPADRAGPGPHRRSRVTRRAAAPQRGLCPAVAPPVRRLRRRRDPRRHAGQVASAGRPAGRRRRERCGWCRVMSRSAR